jgi:hypothetical protein
MDDDLHDLFGDAPRSRPAREEADDAEEAAAKAAVGRVLAGLQDDVRARVVRWVIARFGVDAASEQDTEAPPAAETAGASARRDPMLAVDDLTDLFSPPEDVGDSRRSG